MGLIALPLAQTGCGWTRSVAVGSMVPILEESIEATYRDRDLATVREAIPGNLILVRGLCESQPANLRLRQAATQMYFSYAMGFIEDEDPERAAILYEEGLRLGRAGLMQRTWFRDAERTAALPDSQELLRMEREDVPLVFWTMANWIGWISLNLSEPEAVAQLPRAEAYLRRVLAVEPEYFLGMPHVLMGSLQSFRPRTLGGSPEQGKRHFDEAFRISNRRMLLFHVVYARYYCRQVLDEDGFDQTLREVLEAPADLYPEYRLLNEAARAKARHLMEIRDELF